MNATDKKTLEQFLYNALTSYRIVPLLHAIVNNKHTDSAIVGKACIALHKALVSAGYTDKTSEVFEVLHKYEEWIRYTLDDFRYYADFLHYLPVSVSLHYLKAMEEQVTGGLLNWDWQAFRTMLGGPIVLDVGCGRVPYLGLFREANNGWIHYTGLDKREQDPTIRIPSNMQYSFLTADATGDLEAATGLLFDVNVLFWGNSLHCFTEPAKLVQKFLEACPKVQTILILEPTPGSALEFAFSFHMEIHKKGSVSWDRMLSPVPTREWEQEAIPASSQHTMYRFTKRG